MDRLSLNNQKNLPLVNISNDYRRQRILDIRNDLKDNIKTRHTCKKKYSRVINLINAIDGGSTSVAMVLSAVGVVALSSGVGVPLAIILESVTIGIAGLSLLSKVVLRKLSRKLLKHQQIIRFSEAKLNMFDSIFSKMINDSEIDDQEFQFILDEEADYRKSVEKIRNRYSKTKNAEKQTMLDIESKITEMETNEKFKESNK